MDRHWNARAAQLAIVILSLIICRGAHAGVTLGASFGYTHLSYPGTPYADNDVFGFPGTEQWGQPGLRIGYLATGGRWGVNTDLGLVHVRRSGAIDSDETTAEVLPQIQANARGPNGFDPFVNGGVGLVHETALTAYGGTFASTRAVFGAGLGVRKSVSEGHGLVRIELRYDHLPERVVEAVSRDRFIFPATDRLSVKLGFDLIVAR